MNQTDPLDILTAGTNPQSTAPDLTNHPVVLRAIEASYRQEAEILAAKAIVGIVSRALEMVPVWGPAFANVITGAGDQAAIVAGIQQQLAEKAKDEGRGTMDDADCLQSWLQSPAVQTAVGTLAGSAAVPGLLAALGIK